MAGACHTLLRAIEKTLAPAVTRAIDGAALNVRRQAPPIRPSNFPKLG
jgi:hypothetical protein